MGENEQAVLKQTTITLPFLDDQVPALYLVDGRPYIPVFAVCQALGIRADMHIQRWKNLALWVTARKLPFQTEKRGCEVSCRRSARQSMPREVLVWGSNWVFTCPQ
jgi:hypothetical protein